MARQQMSEGGGLVPPSFVGAEVGQQETLKQSHIKVDDRIFAIDPNLDFDSSIILCEDRAYTADSISDISQPLTWTIQPQYNVFRSFSESRFVFRLQLTLGAVADVADSLQASLKPYFSALFVNDITININNVACNDQHSRTAQYAHFVKTVMLQGDLKPVVDSVHYTYRVSASTTQNYAQQILNSCSSDDHRTFSEGIVAVDGNIGMDAISSSHNVAMFMQNGFLNQIGILGTAQGVFLQPFYVSAALNVNMIYASTNASFEITYIPKDGIWQQPKFLVPGINLNFVMQIQPFSKWLNGWNAYFSGGFTQAQATTQGGALGAPGSLAWITGVTIQSAIYYERQYTITQTALRAFQSVIMRQPVYYTMLTSNTLLFPVSSLNVQLTNLFAGRLPNIIVIGLLNQTPSNPTLNSQSLLTYAPVPGITESPLYSTSTALGRVVPTVACISAVTLTVNGRRYPNLWTGVQTAGSSANVQQWYEQYKQCSLISRLAGREDGAVNLNYDTKYKFDTPLLTLSEFKSCFNLLCFNIRRNGTIVNCSGDKEVGGIEVLLNISSATGLVPPNAQLMLCGLNTDSIVTLSDGGASTSCVF
jgi:hypothetical protein